MPLRAHGSRQGDIVTFRGDVTTEDHVRGGQETDGTRLREPSASVRLHDGTVAERPLWQLTAGEVVAAAPWRPARSARGQARYPGYYWSATSGGHVIYESRLELARLLLADFDPRVTAIAAQPFLLRAQVGGRLRRHVPDFLLVRADHTVQVVNVKPAARLADPAVAEALAWPTTPGDDCAASPRPSSTPTAGAASATSSPAPPPGRSAATSPTPASPPPRCRNSSPGSA